MQNSVHPSTPGIITNNNNGNLSLLSTSISTLPFLRSKIWAIAHNEIAMRARVPPLPDFPCSFHSRTNTLPKKKHENSGMACFAFVHVFPRPLVKSLDLPFIH